MLTAQQIGELLVSLTVATQPAEGDEAMARSKDPEPQDPDEETAVVDMIKTFGPPSAPLNGDAVNGW